MGEGYSNKSEKGESNPEWAKRIRDDLKNELGGKFQFEIEIKPGGFSIQLDDRVMHVPLWEHIPVDGEKMSIKEYIKSRIIKHYEDKNSECSSG